MAEIEDEEIRNLKKARGKLFAAAELTGQVAGKIGTSLDVEKKPEPIKPKGDFQQTITVGGYKYTARP